MAAMTVLLLPLAAALRMSTQLAPIAATDARRSRFRSSSAPPLYCAPTLPLHQAAASSLVQDDDVVLEVGCNGHNLQWNRPLPVDVRLMCLGSGEAGPSPTSRACC